MKAINTNKIVAIILAVAMLVTFMPMNTHANEVKDYSYIHSGNEMVELRKSAEEVGGSVSFDSSSNKIIIDYLNTTLEYPIGATYYNKITKNNDIVRSYSKHKMDCKIVVVNGTSYISVKDFQRGFMLNIDTKKATDTNIEIELSKGTTTTKVMDVMFNEVDEEYKAIIEPKKINKDIQMVDGHYVFIVYDLESQKDSMLKNFIAVSGNTYGYAHMNLAIDYLTERVSMETDYIYGTDLSPTMFVDKGSYTEIHFSNQAYYSGWGEYKFK